MTLAGAGGAAHSKAASVVAGLFQMAGGVLLAVAPYFPWTHTSPPGGVVTITTSLRAFSAWALALTVAGALIATLAFIPTHRAQSLQWTLLALYLIVAVALSISLLRATDFFGTTLRYGVGMAVAGGLAFMVGALLAPPRRRP